MRRLRRIFYFSQKELSQEEIEYTIQGINDAALIIGERLDYREYKIK